MEEPNNTEANMNDIVEELLSWKTKRKNLMESLRTNSKHPFLAARMTTRSKRNLT